MKRLLATSILALLASTAAANAGGNYDWSGFYAGLYGGTAWDSGRQNSSHDMVSNPSDPWGANTSSSSFIGGGVMGLNKQFGNGFVGGLELDLGKGGNSSGHFSKKSGTDPDANFGLTGGLTGSGRVRLGYAMDRVLPFVMGGVSFLGYDVDDYDYYGCGGNNCAGLAHFTGHGQSFGWTVGAGVNYAVSDNIIAGLEYRYTKYGTSVVSVTNTTVGDVYNYNVDLDDHSVRATVAFKF